MTRQDFVRDAAVARGLNGHRVRVCGFVEHANLCRDRATRGIPGEWWGGEASDPAKWRFDLKFHPNEKAGHSIAVYVRNDPQRNGLLSAIVAGTRAGRATEADVTGTLRTFDAPTNAARKMGIDLDADAPSGVLLDRRPVH